MAHSTLLIPSSVCVTLMAVVVPSTVILRTLSLVPEINAWCHEDTGWIPTALVKHPRKYWFNNLTVEKYIHVVISCYLRNSQNYCSEVIWSAKCMWAGPWENVSYVICEQQRRRSACTSAQSDQRLCCSLPRYYNILNFYIWNFKPLASFCSWAGQFESDLVGNSQKHVFSWRGSRSILPIITDITSGHNP